MPKENKLQSKLYSEELNAGIVTMNAKSLTFTVRHAESIENLNVIHSNVSPALSIHQTFDHHLEKGTVSDFLTTFSWMPQWKEQRYSDKCANKSQAERWTNLPDRVCWCVAQGHDLPSSGCLGDHWPSTAGCQPVRQLSVCAVWYAVCQCATRTCGTKKTHTGLSLGSWPWGWPAEPPRSLGDPSLRCRWNSLIHLSDKRTCITDRQISEAERKSDFQHVLRQEVAHYFHGPIENPTGSSPVWSMLGPVLRVGVPLDWICHLEPVSSDVQLQKDGSLAQPKSQANHRKSANVLEKGQDHQRISRFIILLITKGEIAKSSVLYSNNDL